MIPAPRVILLVEWSIEQSVFILVIVSHFLLGEIGRLSRNPPLSIHFSLSMFFCLSSSAGPPVIYFSALSAACWGYYLIIITKLKTFSTYQFSSRIRPICLPYSDVKHEGEDAEILWSGGLSSNSSHPKRLKEIIVNVNIKLLN